MFVSLSPPSSCEDAILKKFAETILVEEGRHLIRTGDSPPETEDPYRYGRFANSASATATGNCRHSRHPHGWNPRAPR
jgi:hypothetical protein